MRKTLTIAVAIMALLGLLLAGVTTASASPSRTKSCTKCHHHKNAVKLKVTRVSSTATDVTYNVTVKGGNGRAGWAVLAGGANLAHASGSTGTFTVPIGTRFRLYGVRKRTGGNYKTITAAP